MSIESGIHDNHKRGPVGDFLKEKIQKDAELSIVSASASSGLLPLANSKERSMERGVAIREWSEGSE
ncbi:MAG: hypothetical protein JRJ85_22910 [Deltaproteobacteria bacterium]|nr:hypothetical protein [Deltaproteobacteria bacterium]